MASPVLIPDGVPLAGVPGLSAEQTTLLAGLWITTAQELVALAQHQPSRELLANALSVDQAGLDRLLALSQRKIPATRALRTRQLELAALSLRFGMGAWLDEPKSELDRRRALPLYRSAAGRSLLPESLSLIDQLPPPRDQGSRGTCVAHAVAALREQLEIAAGCLPDIDLSEQFLYWWCKQHDGSPQMGGTYLATATRCLEEAGLPIEAAWPYQQLASSTEDGGPPPASAAAGAAAYRTLRTVDFNPADIGGMKNRLAEGRLIAVTVPMYPSWYYSLATRRWGKITLPLPGEAPDGGHALALAGYQDEPAAPGGGYFLARNAWGGWAFDSVWHQSYACIPYGYIAQLATDVRSAERMAEAPVFVRDDSARQDGTRPQLTWNSPDIWLRRTADGGQDPQTPRAGAQNAFYARVFNRGPAIAYRVQAQLFAAPLAPAVPTAAWTALGLLASERLAPGENAVLGPLAWQPAARTAESPHAYQVRVDCAADPLGSVLDLSANDNVAEQHLWLIEMAPGESAEVAFPVVAVRPGARTPTLQVEKLNLPPDIQISAVSWISSGNDPQPLPTDAVGVTETGVPGLLSNLFGFLGRPRPAATPSRRASVSIALPASAVPGTRYTFAVVQQEISSLLGRDVQVTPRPQITGRMTVQIRVVRSS